MKIDNTVLEEIKEHAQKDAPIEACGYLAARTGIIVKNYVLENTDKSQEHYTLNPKEQFEVVKKAREDGLEIVAVYHSHPETPARPSSEDIALAYDPNIQYVIVSLCGDVPCVKSFSIKNGLVTTNKMEVIYD